jgi:hypothetical protein
VTSSTRTRRIRAAACTLCSVVLVVAVTAACGGDDTRSHRSFRTPQSLAGAIGCTFTADESEQEEGVRASGSCGQVRIYTFATTPEQDGWFAVAQDAGRVYLVGHRWVVSADTRSTLERVRANGWRYRLTRGLRSPDMTADDFVPADFDPPTTLGTDRFRLEPLGPQHNDSDHAAWTSSIEHIRATPGYPDGRWPPEDGMSLERNLADLRRHADDFARRAGFTFTVLDPASGEVIGCVYIYPSTREEWDVTVQSWVRADKAELDVPLADAVAAWLASDWPWQRVDRCGR